MDKDLENLAAFYREQADKRDEFFKVVNEVIADNDTEFLRQLILGAKETEIAEPIDVLGYVEEGLVKMNFVTEPMQWIDAGNVCVDLITERGVHTLSDEETGLYMSFLNRQSAEVIYDYTQDPFGFLNEPDEYYNDSVSHMALISACHSEAGVKLLKLIDKEPDDLEVDCLDQATEIVLNETDVRLSHNLAKILDAAVYEVAKKFMELAVSNLGLMFLHTAYNVIEEYASDDEAVGIMKGLMDKHLCEAMKCFRHEEVLEAVGTYGSTEERKKLIILALQMHALG